jgi:endonuclease YncB( thermonuclease family)
MSYNPRGIGALAYLVAALLAAVAKPGLAADWLPGPLPAEVTRVVDGDTIEVRVRIWLGQELETLVRIAGIDTPERRGACPAERERAAEAHLALSRLTAERQVVLREIHFGKYAGRVVARVETAAGEDLAQALKALGLARAYDGGRRPGWC